MVSDSKKKTSGYKETLFSILTVVLFISLIVFLIFSNVKIKNKRAQLSSRIESLKEEIRTLEEKNEGLKEEVSQVESQEHLEKIARGQLGMKSPGEEVVVITKEEEEKETEETKEKSFWDPKTWWEWLKGKRD